MLILLSYKLSNSQLTYLRYLIHEYIDQRQSLFPDVSIKPKHHYLLHYPQLIKQFGPLRYLWTMRFESKHQYFKNIIRHTTNYKSVLLSFSHKHQLLQALNLSQNSVFKSKIISEDAVKITENNCAKDVWKILCSNIELDITFISSSCSFREHTYKKENLIC